MSGVFNYTCPNCSAPLKFDSDRQEVHCDSCDGNFDIEQINEYMAEKGERASSIDMKWDRELETVEQNFKEYSCPSCGAKVVCDEHTTSTRCVYCGNPQVIPITISGIYKPDYIIPFKINKEAAKEALRKFYKGKVLLPKEFASENRIEEIQGIYVPFWLFDCKGKVDLRYSATNVEMWRDLRYRYIKTNYYDVQRSGSVLFEKIPMDGSKKMMDDYMEAIEPYDYSEFEEFDMAYLAGFLSDKYDVACDDMIPRAKERINKSIVPMFRKTVKGFITVRNIYSDIQIDSKDIKYALLPVWLLTTRYKGEPYTFAMNGQTGELVGKLPVDNSKTFKYILLFAGIMFGFSMIINAFKILLFWIF